MNGTRNSLFFSLALVAALAPRLGAQDHAHADITPAQRTFGQTYLSAITGPDIERYVRLLHPRTRACITPANAEFFNTIFERRVRRYTKNPHVSVRKLKDSGMIAAARNNGLNYPERPTHAFSVEMISSGPTQYSVTVFAVKENGIWYEVLPCPTGKSLEMLREAKLRNAADSIRAGQLADSLQDPLRAEMLTLLQEAGTVSAAKRYMEAVEVDLAMARRVVKILEKDITLIH